MVKLDVTKLLGFRIALTTGTAGRLGVKPGVKSGAKVGAKVGTKPPPTRGE